MKNEFSDVAELMKSHGFVLPKKHRIQIENANNVLRNALKYFIGDDMVWIPEYDKVADWLADTKGRGLLLMGTNGVGKSVLVQKALPAIILKYCSRVVSVYDYSELNAKEGEIMAKKWISIDDFGCEGEKVDFGQRSMVLPEVMDLVEKRGLFILLSTNLNGTQIQEKYGVRTIERIISTTYRVDFGQRNSFRK